MFLVEANVWRAATATWLLVIPSGDILFFAVKLNRSVMVGARQEKGLGGGGFHKFFLWRWEGLIVKKLVIVGSKLKG
jgi:hypothetical protein